MPTSTAGGGEGGGPELGETCCCQERAHTEVPQAEPGEGARIWLPKEVWGESGVAHSPFYLVKQNSQRKNAPKGGQSVRERPPVGAGTWVWPSACPPSSCGTRLHGLGHLKFILSPSALPPFRGLLGSDEDVSEHTCDAGRKGNLTYRLESTRQQT